MQSAITVTTTEHESSSPNNINTMNCVNGQSNNKSTTPLKSNRLSSPMDIRTDTINTTMENDNVVSLDVTEVTNAVRDVAVTGSDDTSDLSKLEKNLILNQEKLNSLKDKLSLCANAVETLKQ